MAWKRASLWETQSACLSLSVVGAGAGDGDYFSELLSIWKLFFFYGGMAQWNTTGLCGDHVAKQPAVCIVGVGRVYAVHIVYAVGAWFILFSSSWVNDRKG